MTGLFNNPVIGEGKDHGDPFVMEFQGKYYLYHTGGRAVSLYTSENLVNWEYAGPVLSAGGADHWAQAGLWAPEVLYHQGVFYMYVAGTRLLSNGKPDDKARRQGIARSETPFGPFHWDDDPLIPWEWSIDGHPWRGEDGSLWLFYNIRTDATRYVDGTIGCGNVVNRLDAPDKLAGDQVPVTFPTERWEGNKDGSWYWNEGPFVLRRRGIYYQMYSGGCYADDTYGIGFATAQTLAGPWKKFPGNPIFCSTEEIRGPGHHCVIQAPDGVTPYVVYHGYIPGQRGRKVHIDRLFWAGNRVALAGPTAELQPMPPGPVFVPQVPYWHIQAWVQGSKVTVGGVVVPLPSLDKHQLRVVRGLSHFRVYVDQQLMHEEDARIDRIGTIVDADQVWGTTLTSFLDDDAIYKLKPGQRQQWAWGGRSPLEISVAVQGRATLRAGEVEEEIAGAIAPDHFEHVLVQVPHGADAVSIVAGLQGAVVTDLTLTARPADWMK